MKQIWKFKVGSIIEMPKGAEILTVKMQSSFDTCLWALVDSEKETEKREFEIIGTGQEFDSDNRKYVGTWQDGPFVWHLFEVVNTSIKDKVDESKLGMSDYMKMGGVTLI